MLARYVLRSCRLEQRLCASAASAVYDRARLPGASGFGHQTTLPFLRKKCDRHPAVLCIDGNRVVTPPLSMKTVQCGESSLSKLN